MDTQEFIIRSPLSRPESYLSVHRVLPPTTKILSPPTKILSPISSPNPPLKRSTSLNISKEDLPKIPPKSNSSPRSSKISFPTLTLPPLPPDPDQENFSKRFRSRSHEVDTNLASSTPCTPIQLKTPLTIDSPTRIGTSLPVTPDRIHNVPKPKASPSKKRVLDIRIIRAQNLGCKEESKCEPYCVVKIGNYIFQTAKRKGTNNPVWESDCSFWIHKIANLALVRFMIFDGNRDNFLGETRIPMRGIVALDRKSDHSLDLHNPNNFKLKKSVQIQGSLTIQIQFNDIQEGMFRSFGKPVEVFPIRLKPGDIILVDHSKADGMFVSVTTNSRWNHVAIIVPSDQDPNEMKFFEATSNGVNLYPLNSQFHNWMDTSENITFGVRRLLGISSKERKKVEEKLLAFAISVQGKPYETSLFDMAKGLLKAHKEENFGSFFCSELVAACYKHMGLLPPDKISSNYVPGNFGKDMKLEKGKLSDIALLKKWEDPEEKMLKEKN